MIRAVYRQGKIQPLDAVPSDWQEGDELLVEQASTTKINAEDDGFSELESDSRDISRPKVKSSLKRGKCIACGRFIAREWIKAHNSIQKCEPCAKSDVTCVVCGEQMRLVRVDAGLKTCGSSSCALRPDAKSTAPWTGHERVGKKTRGSIQRLGYLKGNDVLVRAKRRD